MTSPAPRRGEAVGRAYEVVGMPLMQRLERVQWDREPSKGDLARFVTVASEWRYDAQADDRMTAPSPVQPDDQGARLSELERACLEGLVCTKHGFRYKPAVGAAAVEAVLAKRLREERAAGAAEALREVGEALRAESVDAHNPLRGRGRDLYGLSVARGVVRTRIDRAALATGRETGMSADEGGE